MNSFKQTPHPILKPIPLEEIKRYVTVNGEIDVDRVMEIHQKIQEREEVLKQAEEDPLNHGFDLEHWKYAEAMLKHYDSLMCLGGNRCLGGRQPIHLVEKDQLVNVEDIDGPFQVRSYDERTGLEVIRTASHPFRKPNQDIYQVQTSDGQLLEASLSHRVLADSQWRSVGELSETVWPDAHLSNEEADDFSELPLFDGDHLLTILDIDLLVSDEGVRRLFETIQDSQSRCSVCYRLGDGPLHRVLGSDQDAPPSPSDVLEHMGCAYGDSDDLVNKLRYTRLYLLSDRPSSLDDLRRFWDLSSDILSDASCTPCISASQLRAYQAFRGVDPRSTVGFSRQSQSTRGFDRRGIRFYYVSAYDGGIPIGGYDGKVDYFCPVVKSDYLRNDVVWDFEVEDTHTYFIGNIVNHNSGKTEFGARAVVKAAIENPNSIIVCFAQDEDASVRIQQSAVYRNLPPDLKKKAKGAVEYVNYSVKNGFTGASLILPNGSQILFHKYSQFIANRAKFEGLELGSKEPKWINIGLWLDEYLEDGDLVETMRFRLATRNAKMVLTFTPIDGYTPFVASYIKDVETTKTRQAELLDNEEVPLTQVNEKKNCGIVYFHSQLNPFGGYSRIAKELAHSTRDEILTRAYGIPVKSMTTLFPLFNTNVHVVDHLPPDLRDKSKWTVYHVVDPASARNYVSLWAAVNERREVVVLREWPDRDTYGPWAEFGDPRWKFGPAAKKLGYNVKGYVDLFKEIEHELGVEVFERIGDSRFFAAENEDNVDLFTAFSEHGMEFVPSDGRHEDMGISKLDEYFHYNPNVEIDEINRPLMTIYSKCGNSIYALQNYGQNGKKDEPLKDFPDGFRYLVMANGGDGPEHYLPEMFEQKQSFGGY